MGGGRRGLLQLFKAFVCLQFVLFETSYVLNFGFVIFYESLCTHSSASPNSLCSVWFVQGLEPARFKVKKKERKQYFRMSSQFL